MNSWEMGVSTALTFPRVVVASLGGPEYYIPPTTRFGWIKKRDYRGKKKKKLAAGVCTARRTETYFSITMYPPPDVPFSSG